MYSVTVQCAIARSSAETTRLLEYSIPLLILIKGNIKFYYSKKRI